MGVSELGPLRYGEDLRTIGFMMLFLSSVIMQWCQREISTESWATWFGLLLLTTFQGFQGGVSVHNAAHCPPFKYESLNRIFFVCLTLWQGASVTTYIPGHNLSHHKYLQTRKDIMRSARSLDDSARAFLRRCHARTRTHSSLLMLFPPRASVCALSASRAAQTR